jgi:tetratricopeptide (TPR) repeat protein
VVPLLGLIGAAVMAVPWGFVNKTQSDGFHVLPTAGGVNLYFGNKRHADGMQPEQGRRVTSGERYEDSGELWARQEYAAAMRAAGRQPDANPMAVSRYWTQRTLDEMKAAPVEWMELMARKCWLMLWNTEIPNNKSFAFQQTENFWLRLLPVRWVVLLMLAPIGIWSAAKWGRGEGLLVVLAFILLYSAANVAFFVCDRYRYPVWPGMAILAGGGAAVLIHSIRVKHWKFLGGIVVVMGLMAAISLPDWVGAKLPSYARDYLFRSIAWYEKGHFAEALGDINRSVELDPNDVNALQQRGNVLLALNRWKEARQDFGQIVERAPDDAGVWNNYGLALEGAGQTNEALKAFTRATVCNPPSKSAFFSLAFAAIQSGQFDQAQNALDRLQALEKGPDAIDLALRSVLVRQRGDANAAATLEQQARALDPAAADWALKRVHGGN